MISKARALVRAAIERYYTVHHNKDSFESELVDEVNGGRVRGFTETKHRVVDAIDYQVKILTEKMEAMPTGQGSEFGELHKMDAARNALEKLRHFVKGMVVSVDE